MRDVALDSAGNHVLLACEDLARGMKQIGVDLWHAHEDDARVCVVVAVGEEAKRLQAYYGRRRRLTDGPVS